MHITFRKLFKDILIYGAGDVALKATAFITMPIYTRIFTPEDYGVWSFILTAIGLTSGVVMLGGEAAYARFYFEVKTEAERQTVTSTWIFFLGAWSVLVVLACLPFIHVLSQWSFGTALHARLFAIGLLTMPLTTINAICGQVLRNNFQARLFSILNVTSSLLAVALSLFAVLALDMGLTGVFAGLFTAVLMMLPVRLWTARSMLRPMFSWGRLRHLLAFGVPYVPATIAYWIFAQSDRIMLAKLSTLAQLGLYSVASNLTSVLMYTNNALGQAWSPHAIQMYEEAPEEAATFCGHVLTYILCGFGLLCVGLTAFSRELLVILAAPRFHAAALVVGPLALGITASATSQVTALGITLSKQTRYITIFSWVAAILNLGLNLMLVPRWGMLAAGWTTAASYGFLTVCYLAVSQRLQPVVYDTRRVLTAVALVLLFTMAVPLLPELTWFIGLVFKAVYCLIFIGSLVITRVIDHREWSHLSSWVHERCHSRRGANT